MSHLLPTARLLAVLTLLACSLAPARAGEAQELAEIEMLRARGGLEATQRLCELVRSGDDAARLAALQTLRDVGLRERGVSDTLRRAVDDRASIEQRTAAVEALGQLGSPEDMQLLVDTLKGRDESLRRVAHQALLALTGHRAQQDFGTWHRWWRAEARKKPAAVRSAIHRMPDAAAGQHAELRKLLARDGWTDAAFLEDAVEEWLSHGDRTVRSTAFYLAAVLRLGEVSSAVESALPHLSGVDGEDGLRAVRALGLSADRLAPHWRKRLESRR